MIRLAEVQADAFHSGQDDKCLGVEFPSEQGGGAVLVDHGCGATEHPVFVTGDRHTATAAAVVLTTAVMTREVIASRPRRVRMPVTSTPEPALTGNELPADR